MDPFDGVMWAYRAVFTQVNVAGGAIKVLFTAKERTVILYGNIGQDDYAAGRNILGVLEDTLGNVIGNVLYFTSVDNIILPFPVAKAAAVVDGSGNEFEKNIILGAGDILRFLTGALVQNEVLTITVRALVKTKPPDVTTTGSGGTVTITEVYNKVI